MVFLPYKLKNDVICEILPLKKRDLNECFKIVARQNKDKNLKQKMNSYINANSAVGVKMTGRLIAFAFWFFGENGVSLTHFYIDEFYRKKPFSLWFVTQLFLKFGDKKVFIHSKDVWAYKSMLKPTRTKDEYEVVLPELKVKNG